MKCPECGGYGKVGKYNYYGTCPQCGGTGEMEMEMTNEEYLRSCTTEQLAEYLWRSKKSYWSTHLEDTDKMEIEDMLWWLKQPHKME